MKVSKVSSFKPWTVQELQPPCQSSQDGRISFCDLSPFSELAGNPPRAALFFSFLQEVRKPNQHLRSTQKMFHIKSLMLTKPPKI